ncbi:MAG: hypothetical protein HYV62_11555, partial [Candidatus Rokubacteria bacterium]|nr:hypothetical protein [Candidatus Rokubacteria bacterium]
RLTVAGLAILTLAGCGLLYTDVRAPRAYRSATPSDVKAAPTDQTVSGQACYQSLLYLVAWGDAGYAAATANALGGDAAAILYDVKADVKATLLPAVHRDHGQGVQIARGSRGLV